MPAAGGQERRKSGAWTRIVHDSGGRGIAAAVSRLVRVRLHSTHPPNSLQHASAKLQYFRLHRLELRLGK